MRILVLGAAGPAGVNVLRSLHEAGHDLIAHDANRWHLEWCKPYAETVCLTQLSAKAVNMLGADLIHAQPDPLVWWLSQHRAELDALTLLPSHASVLLCQDKYEAGLAFRRAALRSDWISLISDDIDLQRVENVTGYPYWLRARVGAGARGAALVRDWKQAHHWVRYWQARHDSMEFVSEAYLPGRDLAWSSLWYGGELVTSFGRERLEYIYPALSPSGLTGTPTVARTVHDSALNYMGEEAVHAIDPLPHGLYSVDFKEDETKHPRPTEVNCGRCFTTSYLSTAAGLNLMGVWAQLAEGTVPDVPKYDAVPAGLLWIRHVDCPPVLIPDSELVGAP